MTEHVLSYLNDQDRLTAYNKITAGCSHLWSKGVPQTEKIHQAIQDFAVLAEQDPYFLAHFTSWVLNNSDSNDLKVISTFVNSLSDADGTPFSQGSSYTKPNLRQISQAAFQKLGPNLAYRVVKLANTKISVSQDKPRVYHWNKTLRTATKKYLGYRETSMDSIKKQGLARKIANMYRFSHQAPTPGVAAALRWEQKAGYPGHGVTLADSKFDFTGLNDVEVANKIQRERLPALTAIGAMTEAMTPIVAAAILEQCTGNQAVILTEVFERQGLLKHVEIRQIYEKKVATAKTALDRVERINTIQDEEVKKILKTAKAESRKKKVGDLGKVFLHIDTSSSMFGGLELAKEKGATIAECVSNPEENFHWGLFASTGRELPKPVTFEKDAFQQALYGYRAIGATDCLALWERSRALGCTTDVYFTDQGHTHGPIAPRIEAARVKGYADPQTVVIVNISNGWCSVLKDGFESAGIPVAEITPETLGESALVAEAIRYALKGASAVIDEIMGTPLLPLPRWWESV